MARYGKGGPSEKHNCACILSEEEWQFLQTMGKFYMIVWQVLNSFSPSSSLLPGAAEKGKGMAWELELSCSADVTVLVQVWYQTRVKHK